MGKWIEVKRNVAYTQAYGCWLCLHIGSVAIFVGRRDGYGARLELFTGAHQMRLTGW